MENLPDYLGGAILAGIFLYYWGRWAHDKFTGLATRWNEMNWVDNRLPLAQMLAGFPSLDANRLFFEPDKEFYRHVSNGLEGIPSCISRICNHIRYSGPPLTVSLVQEEMDSPATIVGTEIRIRWCQEYNIYAIGAILAHEVTHAFLRFTRSWPQNAADSEQLTDLVAISLGLGKLILNGLESTSFSFNAPGVFGGTTYYGAQNSHLGYLSYNAMLYAYRRDCDLKHATRKSALRNLRYRLGWSFQIQGLYSAVRTMLGRT